LKTQPKWLAKLDELAVAIPCTKKQKANPTVDLTDDPIADPSADPSASTACHMRSNSGRPIRNLHINYNERYEYELIKF
jgi:hypothetical protein